MSERLEIGVMGIYRPSPPGPFHHFHYGVEVTGPAGDILYRLYPVSNFEPRGYKVYCERQVLSNNFDEEQPSGEAGSLIAALKQCEELYTSDFWGHSTNSPTCSVCQARCYLVQRPSRD